MAYALFYIIKSRQNWSESIEKLVNNVLSNYSQKLLFPKVYNIEITFHFVKMLWLWDQKKHVYMIFSPKYSNI